MTTALALTSRASPAPLELPPSSADTLSSKSKTLVRNHLNIPADVLLTRQQHARNKYIEYVRSKRSSRGRFAKRVDVNGDGEDDDKQECDPMDEKKEVPFSYLQEAITDQCNNLEIVLGNNAPGGDPEVEKFWTIQKLGSGGYSTSWESPNKADVEYGPAEYFGEVKDDMVSIWTERKEYHEHFTNSDFPITTRENEPRNVGWWYQKPVDEPWNWNDCFDDYRKIIQNCERPGQYLYGSTGGTNHVPSKKGNGKFLTLSIHVFTP
ncbi:hypothetical protein ABW20_dc0109869 [Dactylellina cionopaga]|nr:hypothetical protein ABW20_dc0109869 [Dactylellina cionopaga]